MTKEELSNWMFDKFPICGCGDPELVLIKLRDLLEYFSKEHEDRDRSDLEKLIDVEPTGHPKTADGWLWMYLLDHLKLTEHGSSINGMWTLGTGDKILAALKEHGCDPEKWNDTQVRVPLESKHPGSAPSGNS